MSDHNHLNDSLYPKNIYRCTECGTEHGTRAFNGAVNWQCPNEFLGPNLHEPAKQEYVGFHCWCGEEVRETLDDGIARIRAARAVR